MINVGQAMGYLDLDTSGFTNGFTMAMQNMQRFLDSTQSSQRRLEGLGKSLTTIGGGLNKYVTLPLVGAGSAMLYFGQEAEKAFRKFQTGTGKSAEEAEKYKNVMDDVFKNNWGESYEDVADAMTLINQQLGDMPVESMEKVTSQALAFRDTFNTTLNEGIRGANALMKQFGVNAETAYNLMIQGAQQGLNQNEDLADQLSEYSIYYKQLGFNVEEMFAAMTTGIDNGIYQIDYLNDALKEFNIKAIDGSKSTAEGFAMIGLNADEMAEKLIQGGDTAKQAFFEVVNNLRNLNDEVARNQAGAALFGTRWEDVGQEMIVTLSNMRSEIFLTKDAFQQLDEASMPSLTRELQSLAASFGELILPYAIKFVEALNNILETVNNFSDGTKELILTLGLIAAAIGPVVSIIGNLIFSFTQIQGMFAGISSILATTGISLSSLLLPIAAVIAAVVALGAAWATNFAGIRDKTSEIVNLIVKIISQFINIISAIFGDGFLGIQDIVSVALGYIENIISSVLDIIISILNIFYGILTGNWSLVWESVVNILSNVLSIIGNLIGLAFDTLITAVINLGVGLYNAAKNAFGKLAEGAAEKMYAFDKWFNTAMQDPVQAVKDIGGALYNGGKNLIISLWNGAKSKWNDFSAWFGEKMAYLSGKIDEANGKAKKSVLEYGKTVEGLKNIDLYNPAKEEDFIEFANPFKDLANEFKNQWESEVTPIALDTGKKTGSETGKALKDGLEEQLTDVQKMFKDFGLDFETAENDLNEFGNAITDALKEQYEEEKEIREKALDDEIEKQREISNEKIDLYNEEYKAKLKTIDEAAAAEIEALEAQIDAIDAKTEAEKKAEEERKEQEEIDDALREFRAEDDPEKRLEAYEKYQQLLADKKRRIELEEREAEKERLKEEIEQIKEDAEAKKKAEEEILNELTEKEKKFLSEKETQYGVDKEALNEWYAEVTTAQNLQFEARKLAEEQNNDEIIKLLNSYNPDWKAAGQSFIQNLIDGLEDKQDDLRNTIINLANLYDELNKVQSASIGVDGSYKTGLRYVPYDGFIAELHEGERVLTKEDNENYNKNVSSGDVYNFYSPKALTPVETAKQLKKAKRDILGGFA